MAVAHAALKLGIARLDIYDQDPARAARLAADLNGRFGEGRAAVAETPAAVLPEADGLIHATPVGMPAHPGMPVAADLIEPRHWVADIVYMPLITQLIATAAAKGCRTLPGGGMAIFQAVGAFRLFCGREPDAERMSAHFAEMFNAEAAA